MKNLIFQQIMLLLLIGLYSCNTDSVIDVNYDADLIESKSQENSYIPLNAENIYKYAFTATKTNKTTNETIEYKDLINVSMDNQFYYRFNYHLDTNWNNYFAKKKIFTREDTLSSAYYGESTYFVSFMYSISDSGYANAYDLWATAYKDTITVNNKKYDCIVIEEILARGNGKGTTYYAKGLGAIKYKYIYETELEKQSSEMTLIYCDLK